MLLVPRVFPNAPSSLTGGALLMDIFSFRFLPAGPFHYVTTKPAALEKLFDSECESRFELCVHLKATANRGCHANTLY